MIVLNLLQSHITTLGNAPFTRQHKLKQLLLGGNIISVIHQHSFKGLKSMEVLDLHGVDIVLLQKKCFYDLKSLKVLNISHNHLQSINENVFHGLASLDKLDLSNNPIMTITKKTFANLNSMIYVSDCNLCCFVLNRAICNIRDSTENNKNALNMKCNNVLPNNHTALISLSLLMVYLLGCISLNIYFQWKSPVWNDQTCAYLFFSFNDFIITVQCLFLMSAHLFYGDSYPLIRQHISRTFLCIAFGSTIMVTQITTKLGFLCLALIYKRITIHAMVKQPYTMKMICLFVALCMALVFGVAVALVTQINTFRPPFCYPYHDGKYIYYILYFRSSIL